MMRIFQFHTLALFAVLLQFSCGSGGNATDSTIEVAEATHKSGEVFVTNAQYETMKMELGKAEKKTFSEEITIQAMVKVPVEGMVEMSAYFGGYVSNLKLVEGQPVKKGEVLFQLENPDFIRLQQDYLEASSQLAYLKSEFERQQTLYKENIASQKNYLKAESEYKSTLAKAQSLKKQLALINLDADKLTPETIRSKVPVLSPVNGFVVDVFVVPGTFLPASGKAVSLISREHLHVELMVFEKDATKVRKGQKVKLSSLDLNGQELESEVYMVGQMINESRQIMVHSHLTDETKEALLVPGMYLEAKLQLEPKESWSVPTPAVIESDGETFILVLKSKESNGLTLQKIKVTAHENSENWTAVDLPNGWDGEAEVLTKGAFYLIQ